MSDTTHTWQLRGPRVHGIDAIAERLTIAGTQIGRRDDTATGIDLPTDWHIVPGFIDAHIHGAMGDDVMDADPDGLNRMATYLPSEGTTAFLGTTMTSPVAAIDAALGTLAAFESRPGTAEMLGVHLEGPFVNPAKAGAQPVEQIINPDVDQFDRWQALSGNRIRVVTLAPERDGGEALVRHLSARGVRASMGHTACNAAQAAAAIEQGANRGTHLFNAMQSLHHREPGAPCALLTDARARAEIIADGLHVAPGMIRLAWQTGGRDKLIAITDAMRAKGLGDGEYELGGQAVTVSNGEARIANGSLAGSVLTFDAAFRNLAAFTGCGLADVVAMTSTNAARDLGVAHRKGRLEAGWDADIVVLDADLNVRMTLCRGQVAHDPDHLATA